MWWAFLTWLKSLIRTLTFSPIISYWKKMNIPPLIISWLLTAGIMVIPLILKNIFTRTARHWGSLVPKGPGIYLGSSKWQSAEPKLQVSVAPIKLVWHASTEHPQWMKCVLCTGVIWCEIFVALWLFCW